MNRNMRTHFLLVAATLAAVVVGRCRYGTKANLFNVGKSEGDLDHLFVKSRLNLNSASRRAEDNPRSSMDAKVDAIDDSQVFAGIAEADLDCGSRGGSDADRVFQDQQGDSEAKSSGDADIDRRRREILEVRNEIIRAQILQKLKLKEAPTGISEFDRDQMRFAIEVLENRTAVPTETEADIGNAESFVAFPNNTDYECGSGHNSTPDCSLLEFSLPPDTELLTSVDLWVHRTSAEGRLHVSEAYPKDFRGDDVLAREKLTDSRSPAKGWVRLELPPSVRLHRSHRRVGVALEVSGPQVSLEGAERPFLSARAERRASGMRSRRDAACDSGTGCCLRNLTINFAELGYDQWIGEPSSFQANYCDGECPHSLSSSPSGYHRFLYTHMMSSGQGGLLSLCCVPSKMEPLSIVWGERPPGQNETIVRKSVMPDMRVVACDCL